MIKVDVFYGSFQQLKYNYNVTSSYIEILDVLDIIDEMIYKDKTYSFDNHETKLVCFTEDYSQLTETGLRRFHKYVQRINLEYIILQNPPNLVLDNFKRLENQIDLKLSVKYAEAKDMSESELVSINHKLNTQIIGQQKAKSEVLRSLYTLYKKRKDKKPVVLMLYGPSGVGKTETAKIINKVKDDYLQRLNMSMFQNQYFINYLFGENHNAKSFAVDLLENQPSVILLDEFDKAPNVVHNAFYKAFDESQFDDSHYQVNLENLLFICTSNYQSKAQIQEHIGEPLYNRFNDIIQYNSLSEKEVNEVVNKLFDTKYCELDEQEKASIKELNLKRIVKNYAYDQGFNNFRSIESAIEKLFNHVLLKELIANNETK